MPPEGTLIPGLFFGGVLVDDMVQEQPFVSHSQNVPPLQFFPIALQSAPSGAPVQVHLSVFTSQAKFVPPGPPPVFCAASRGVAETKSVTASTDNKMPFIVSSMAQ